MNYTPSQNDIVNDYLDNLDEEIAPLFLEIRACILDAAPSFNESIKWKDCLVYGTTKNHIQTVVGKGKVSLIFFEGASFEDCTEWTDQIQSAKQLYIESKKKNEVE